MRAAQLKTITALNHLPLSLNICTSCLHACDSENHSRSTPHPTCAYSYSILPEPFYQARLQARREELRVAKEKKKLQARQHKEEARALVAHRITHAGGGDGGGGGHSKPGRRATGAATSRNAGALTVAEVEEESEESSENDELVGASAQTAKPAGVVADRRASAADSAPLAPGAAAAVEGRVPGAASASATRSLVDGLRRLSTGVLRRVSASASSGAPPSDGAAAAAAGSGAYTDPALAAELEAGSPAAGSGAGGDGRPGSPSLPDGSAGSSHHPEQRATRVHSSRRASEPRKPGRRASKAERRRSMLQSIALEHTLRRKQDPNDLGIVPFITGADLLCGEDFMAETVASLATENLGVAGAEPERGPEAAQASEPSSDSDGAEDGPRAGPAAAMSDRVASVTMGAATLAAAALAAAAGASGGAPLAAGLARRMSRIFPMGGFLTAGAAPAEAPAQGGAAPDAGGVHLALAGADPAPPATGASLRHGPALEPVALTEAAEEEEAEEEEGGGAVEEGLIRAATAAAAASSSYAPPAGSSDEEENDEGD